MLACSATEIGHAIAQASILQPVTKRLLSAAGIGSGMRVLDLACGIGDLSFLAAELVGPTGLVVGIDSRRDIIAIARGRAAEKRLKHVTFKCVLLEALSGPAAFDAVIGRYVSAHQPDLTRALCKAKRLARAGAVVALHEGEPPSAAMTRPVSFAPIWSVVGPTLAAACRETLTEPEAARSLMTHFADAGLPLHGAFCEVPVACGGDRAPWSSELACVADGVVPIDGIRAEDPKARRRLARCSQICAWTRTPADGDRRHAPSSRSEDV
jgi:ubiquinone/menaquinone biosynthesis C-methylase UbiE